MARGLLVAVEGIDGAGTSTQAALLVDSLRRRGHAAHLTREPSDGPVGALIRQVLRGRVVAGPGKREPLGWETMALLFAADRMDHVRSEIEPNLAEGIDVVTDRYYHSSIAYQAETSGQPETWSWIRSLNRSAPPPDLTVLCEVDGREAARRRAARRGSREIYDDLDLQERLARFYRRLPSLLEGERFAIVDANRSVEVVHGAIVEAVEAARAGSRT